MYSHIFSRKGGVENNRAKEINYQVAKKLNHANFLASLKNPEENRLINRRIGPEPHRLYSIEENNRGLCAVDDNRVLLEKRISSLPLGHIDTASERFIYLSILPSAAAAGVAAEGMVIAYKKEEKYDFEDWDFDL